MRSVVLLLFDLAVVVGTAIAALALRDNLELSAAWILDLTPYLVFSLTAAVVVLPVAGANRTFWHYSTFDDFLRVAIAAMVIVLFATGATFAYNRLDGLARAVPILHAVLLVLSLCVLRAAMRLHHGLRTRRRAAPVFGPARQAESVLVIGVNAVAELFVRSVREFARDAVHVAGVLGTDGRHRGHLLHGVQILGAPEDLTRVLRQLEVHGVELRRIVVAMPPSELSAKAREALQAVEDGTGITVDYFAERLGFAERTRPGSAVGSPAGPGDSDGRRLPSLPELMRSSDLARPFWRGKRIVDFLAALLLLIATAPVMLLVAVAVALDVGVPVLFWQERPGRFGRRLRLYKFRTMRSAHDVDGNRIAEERRSSPIGRFLRRTRLDELPQLFHILTGEMSFVGPRPLLSSEQAPAHAARLAVRPGLSGWAQVHGGRAVSISDKAAMDLWYIRHASFRTDVLIAWKTARMILFGEKPDGAAVDAAWRDAEEWLDQLGAGRGAGGVMNAAPLRIAVPG